MDRVQLKNVIGSGRAVALDLYSISETIPESAEPGPIFALDILNKTVVLKRFGTSLPSARLPVFIDTVVYFPYDNKQIYDGGESISFTHHSFGNEILRKITYGGDTTRFEAHLQQDLEMLQFLHGLHSLDPFLIKSYAIKEGLTGRINEAYFQLPASEWKLIEQPIREKVFRLVTKAIGVKADAAEDDATLRYVARFLRKVWEAKDIDGIEPFVEAMQIPSEQATDAFFAWKAVSYYQVRFAMLRDKLRKFLAWVGQNDLFYPSDFLALPERQRQELRPKINSLKVKIKDAYNDAQRVLRTYEEAYHTFIAADKPAGFKEFLVASDRNYLILARCVSVFWHAVNVHEAYAGRHGEKLASGPFFELLDCLCMLFGVEEAEGR